jgi:hypothetical protein
LIVVAIGPVRLAAAVACVAYTRAWADSVLLLALPTAGVWPALLPDSL